MTTETTLVGQTPLTREAVLDRVRGLLPGIRDRAARSEEQRTIPRESAQEFLAAGLLRILTPRQFGGAELGLHTFIDVVVEIATADVDPPPPLSGPVPHGSAAGRVDRRT